MLARSLSSEIHKSLAFPRAGQLSSVEYERYSVQSNASSLAPPRNASGTRHKPLQQRCRIAQAFIETLASRTLDSMNQPQISESRNS
jgi:hypothetical protein